MNHFHSEYAEDQWLWNHYEDYFVRPRFYVDVGCAGPVHGSNTAWLRGLGWKGLHIDGDHSWEDQWGGNFIHAIIHTEPRVHFTEIEGAHCLSRIENGEPNVDTRRLDEILFCNHIDQIGFMSIDVEGQETEVLRSMSQFPNWPDFIISEYNTAGIGEDYSARKYLETNGYEVVHQTFANFVYKRK